MSDMLRGSEAPDHESPVVRDLETHRTARGARQVDVTVDGADLVVVKRATDRTGQTAILREAAILAQLRHPNVVEVVRSERTDHGAALVTAFAGRHTFADVVVDDAADVARLGANLLTIVTELHDLRWVHGRITAEHCLVDGDGRLTLCGLAAARRIDRGDRAEAADTVAAVAVVRALAARLPEPVDRTAARRARRLERSFATADGAPAHQLVAEWSAIATSAGDAGALTTTTARRGASRRPPRPKRGAIPHRRPAPRTPTRRRAIASTAATTVGLLGAVWLLRWVGGPLGLAAPRSTEGVERVSDLPDSVLTALAVLRVAALGAALYGIALSSATLAAILTRRPDLERLATRMAPPRLRRALVAVIGAGIVAGAVPGDAPSTRVPTRAPTTTTTPVATTATTASPSTLDPRPIVHEEPPSPPDRPESPTTSPPTVAPVEPTGLPALHVVRGGDHLWGIAEQALDDHLGRRPTDAEVDAYWRRLLALNRDTLLDPAEPDLIVPGQVVELPPLDAPAG